MSLTKPLLDTLKAELRKQRITYRQVGEKLELSEASVKRLFSEASFSLERLGIVCEMLGLDFSELVRLMEHNIEFTQQLTLEQEKELVSDIRLLLMAHFLINRMSFREIIENYDIAELEGIQLLAKLDRMKIIQLLPGNRVKLMISGNFGWIRNGPIQRFYEQKVQPDFFNSSFTHAGEVRIFLSGLLSRESNAEIINKLKHLAEEFNELNENSERLPVQQRCGTSLILAMRPWEPEIFKGLRKNINKKSF